MAEEKEDNSIEERIKKHQLDPELALFEEVSDAVEAIKEVAENLKPLGKLNFKVIELKGEEGKQGVKGDKPSKEEIISLMKPLIPKPIPGRDGRDGKAGESIIGPMGPEGPQGESIEGSPGADGKNGSPDTAPEIRDKLSTLLGNERLSINAIKGLEQLLNSVLQGQSMQKSRVGGYSGSANPFDVRAGSVVAKNVRSITFIGATMVDRNGDVTVSISGGGSANVIFGEVVSGNTNTFTLAHTPVGTIALAANGQVLTLNTDYTISGAIITTLAPWAAGAVIADYQY